MFDVKQNVSFSKNAAGADIGAFYANTANVGGDFEVVGNTANASYGGAYILGATSITGDATISDNKAVEGAVGALRANSLEIGGDLVANQNTAGGSFGALRVDADLNVVGNATLDGNVTGGDYGALSANTANVGGNLEVVGNTANGSYGGAYIGGAMTITGDATLSDNKAVEGAVGALRANSLEVGGNLVANQNTAGGSFGALRVDSVVNVVGDATLEGNVAGGNYGAIFASKLQAEGNVDLLGNKASGSYGGGYFTGASNVGGNLTVTGNTAGLDIGGLSSAALRVEGNLVANKNVAGREIGAIQAGSLSVGGDLTANDNAATTHAGALRVESTLQVDGSATLMGNTAGGSYGAAYIGEALDVKENVNFSNNSANANIGAFYAKTATVGGALEVVGNTAKTSYGGAYIVGATTITGDATISGNKAVEGSYGALRAGALEVGGNLVANQNTAGGSYGALRVDAVANVVGNATLDGNVAGGNYGAIYAKSATVGGNLEVVGNTANASYGGAYISGSMTITGDATISGNKASGNVGAIKAANVAIGGAAEITGNVAGGATGAVATKNLSAASLVLSNNEAQGGDNGALNLTGALTVTGDATISGNKAFGNVGAVLATDVTIGGAAKITGNVATGATGAIATKNLSAASLVLSNNEAQGGDNGALNLTGALTTTGDATITGNKASGHAGAIQAANVTIGGAADIADNVAGGLGGAIFSNGGSVSLQNATITGNSAGTNGGAIYASTVSIKNALIANNTAAGFAGAIYAKELELVNATVANNSAANAGALYVGGSAKIDNSILAGNSVAEDGQGVEIFAEADANVVLRSSLIQNAESTGAKEFNESWLVEEYRSFIGVDPLFVDPANGDFSLKAESPVINAGSNKLAQGLSDLDLAGNNRYVGLTVDGSAHAIDLGAYEFQTIVAPDLALSENSVNFWYGQMNGVDVDYYFVGEDIILDFSFLNKGDALVSGKFNVSYKIDGTDAEGNPFSVTIVQRYTDGATYFDWQDEEAWILANGEVLYARQNLGALPVGSYTLTITLDADNEIVEYGEEDGSEADNNNVYTTKFEVHEIPSVVVTTDEDGEYNPLDDKVTLREAVELYAGPTFYSYNVLIASANYVDVDLNRISVINGVAYVDYNVATIDGVQQRLKDGDSFAYLDGYVVYDPATSSFVYPDGTVAQYEKSSVNYELTITVADGSTYVAKPILRYQYLENNGEPYSDADLDVYVDVLVAPDGSQTLLSKLTADSIYYGTEHVAYRANVAVDEAGKAISIYYGAAISFVGGEEGVLKNGAVLLADGSYEFLKSGDAVVVNGVEATWVGAAFVKEEGDGSAIAFENGESLELLDSTLEMGVAQHRVLGRVTTDGEVLVFNEDGSTKITRSIGNNVVFAQDLVDSKATITLSGKEITVAKDMTIGDAASANKVTVSGDGLSRVLTVNEGVNATISSIKFADGAAQIGGAILNNGSLILENVGFNGNAALANNAEDDVVLREGLGGAIYNAGELTVNTAEFANNNSAYFGGAIYSVGSLDVNKAVFRGNASGQNGGAIFVLNSSASIVDSAFGDNAAERNGGAIAASIATGSGELNLVNTLVANNAANAVNGGAIYAFAAPGAALAVNATNTTIVDNTAVLGGGLYASNAKVVLNNTILASNSQDLVLENGASAKANSSLIGDGEAALESGSLLVKNSFVGTTDAPIDPKLDSSYAPTAASPALNSGSNELAVDLDGSAIEKDVLGQDRFVGYDVDGKIHAVDMGAVESQKLSSADLTFAEETPALVGKFGAANGVDLGEFVEGWDVVFDYQFGNYGDSPVFTSFDYTITVSKLDKNGEVVSGSEKTFVRTYGSEAVGFLDQSEWLDVNALVAGEWNLGTFETGFYAITLTVDSGDKVVEGNEENNVYTATFSVCERQGLVVTTAEDVVDSHDGLTSLREALANVGKDGSSTVSIEKTLAEGDSFVLENGATATYQNGSLVFANDSVALEAGVEYALQSGESLVWNGVDSVVLSVVYGNTVTFAESVYGSTITLTNGELTIDRTTTIAGDDANITINANGNRAFVTSHGDVTVNGLKITGASAEQGGAIYNATNLALNDAVFIQNSADQGGAIYNATNATVTATNVDFTGNASNGEGGSIYNAGSVNLENANFEDGVAKSGAAIYNAGSVQIDGATFTNGVASESAGAIYNAGGVLNVANAEFNGSIASNGGAIVNALHGSATIADSSFVGNTAAQDAGAIDNYGALTLTNATFTNNRANGFGGAIYNSQSSTSDMLYSVDLDAVTFSGNNAQKGGAIYNSANSVLNATNALAFTGNSAENGGAVYNRGSFTALDGATLEANTATEDGGALYNDANAVATFEGAAFTGNSAANGGAVYNAGTFYATSSNLEGNVATANGGAIYGASASVTSVSNSLVWKNSAGQSGGAVYTTGALKMRNATVAGNSANLGGGVYSEGATNLYNTILASNYATQGADLRSTQSANLYNSLLGSAAGVGALPTMASSKTGAAGFMNAPVFENGALANASSVDIRIKADSPAIDAGRNSYALDATESKTLEYDYSGETRVCNSLRSIDIGAYEYPFEEPSVTVTTEEDIYSNTDDKISLREAIDYAVSMGVGVVYVDPSVKNISLLSTLEINDSVTIVAENGLTLDGSSFVGSVVSVGSVNEDIVVGLEKITITGGNNVNSARPDDPNYIGGGLVNYAKLTLTNVTVDNNVSAYGGGVYNAGDMTVIGSTITNNSAQYYGGFYNRGDLYVEDTTIAGNSARYYGGGVGTYAGATFVNSTILGNSAQKGAGVYAQINAVDVISEDRDWSVNFVNSTVAGNVAAENGGGVWANHILNVDNSIIYGNVASNGADVYAEKILADSAATIRYSNVGTTNASLGTGSVSVDPKFKNFTKPTSANVAKAQWATWDLSLLVGSPMIDSGSTDLAVGRDGALTLDHAGLDRVASTSVDMGAYEEQGNLAPTSVDLALSGALYSNAKPGTIVGLLSTTDGNADDSFVYTLVSDDTNALAIEGDKLVVSGTLAVGEYDVVIRSTDSGLAYVENTFTLVVSEPVAAEYATPTITTIGMTTSGKLGVVWETSDPAKEYVVEYRLKGTGEWLATSALTGNYGILNASFNVGDVVEARIKALASSVKDESQWSDVVEYTIAAPVAEYTVRVVENKVGSNTVATVVIESNGGSYAWWAIDWNDGSALSTSSKTATKQTFSHIYTSAGVYQPIVYVGSLDPSSAGLIVVNPASSAVLDSDSELVDFDSNASKGQTASDADVLDDAFAAIDDDFFGDLFD